MDTTAGADEGGVPVTSPLPADDGSRPADGADADLGEPGPIDRPFETPEADLLDQLRDVDLDDERDP